MNNIFERDVAGNLEIDLGNLFKLYLSNILKILFITLIGGALGFVIAAFVITPKYEATTDMYVNNRAEANETTTISSSDVTAAKSLTDTYAVILTSYPTLSEVISDTGVSYGYEALSKMIKTKAVNGTEIIRITVESEDPQEAAIIANSIGNISLSRITEIVTGSSVKIVSNARIPTKASSPNIVLFTAIGAFLFFIIICVWIFGAELAQSGLSIEEKIREEFKTPVLAAIPFIGRHKKNSVAALCDNMDFACSEAYKLLRTNLSFCIDANQDSKIIGITSLTKAEGKSTTAINLTYTISQTGKNVCLIDCDMREGRDALLLRLKVKPGLSDLISGQAELDDTIQQYVNGNASFSFISTGTMPVPNPSELLVSKRMSQLLNALANVFDYVILDLPPAGLVSDPLALASEVSTYIAVVREDFYDRRSFSKFIQMFTDVSAPFAGVVITYSTALKKSYKKYGYGYGYGYGTTKNASSKLDEAPKKRSK